MIDFTIHVPCACSQCACTQSVSGPGPRICSLCRDGYHEQPKISPEVWEELRKLQALQNALTGATLDIMKLERDLDHRRTLKAIADLEGQNK